MVIVLDAKAAVTPDGKPVAVPIPVAPVVAWVMFVNAVLIHKVGEEEAAPAAVAHSAIAKSPNVATPKAAVVVAVRVPMVGYVQALEAYPPIKKFDVFAPASISPATKVNVGLNVVKVVPLLLIVQNLLTDLFPLIMEEAI